MENTKNVDPYQAYWERKRIMNEESPSAPVVEFFDAPGLCPSEKLIFEAIQGKDKLLDFGAGDLRLQKKFKEQGFKGEYQTLDRGHEFDYTYKDLSEVNCAFDAILLMDVIEHLHLHDGLELLKNLIDKLNPGGVLVLQTPNGRCIRNQLGTDMTHLHIYNLKDLWSYFRSLGLEVDTYRVSFALKKKNLSQRLQHTLSKAITTRLLGADYADNILLIARKVEGKA